MTPVLLLAVAVGGGVGALLRFAVTTTAPASWMPWPVAVCNIAGSFVAGLGGAWLQQLDPAAATVLVSGFCGGLTTFSTFAVEAVQLRDRRRTRLALAAVAANLILGVAAASLGGLLGSLR